MRRHTKRLAHTHTKTHGSKGASLSIRITCAGCKKQFNVNEDMAGKRLRCPACKGVIEVPDVTVVMNAPGSSPTSTARMMPQKTAAMPSPSVRLKGGTASQESALCPSCGKSMPANSGICPSCKFNVKLGRKLSLGSAIDDAAREPGVRADGTRYVTRADKAKLRDTEGQKLKLGMVAAAAIIFLIGALILAWRVAGVLMTPDLSELIARHEVAEVTEEPGSFHPLRIGSTITLSVGVDRISVEEAAPLPESAADPVSAWCEANRLPFHHSEDQLFGAGADAVIATINRNGGSFTPDTITAATAPKTLLVWRQEMPLTEKGALTGAVLDVGDQSETLGKEIKELADKARRAKLARAAYIDRKVQEAKDGEQFVPAEGSEQSVDSLALQYRQQLEKTTPQIKVPVLELNDAKLEFLYCRRMSLTGGSGTYAESIQANASLIRDPASKALAPEPPKGAAVTYFIPVLVAKGAAVNLAGATAKPAAAGN